MPCYLSLPMLFLSIVTAARVFGSPVGQSKDRDPTAEDASKKIPCESFQVTLQELDIARNEPKDELILGATTRRLMIVKADRRREVLISFRPCPSTDARPSDGNGKGRSATAATDTRGTDDSRDGPVQVTVGVTASLPGREKDVEVVKKATKAIPFDLRLRVGAEGSSPGTRFKVAIEQVGGVNDIDAFIDVEELGFNVSYKDVTAFVHSSFGDDFSTGFVGTVGYRADEARGGVQRIWNFVGLRGGVGLSTLSFRRHFEAMPDDDFPVEVGVSFVISFHDYLTLGVGRNLTADNIKQRNYFLVGTSLAKIIGFIKPEPKTAK